MKKIRYIRSPRTAHINLGAPHRTARDSWACASGQNEGEYNKCKWKWEVRERIEHMENGDWYTVHYARQLAEGQ